MIAVTVVIEFFNLVELIDWLISNWQCDLKTLELLWRRLKTYNEMNAKEMIISYLSSDILTAVNLTYLRIKYFESPNDRFEPPKTQSVHRYYERLSLLSRSTIGISSIVSSCDCCRYWPYTIGCRCFPDYDRLIQNEWCTWFDAGYGSVYHKVSMRQEAVRWSLAQFDHSTNKRKMDKIKSVQAISFIPQPNLPYHSENNPTFVGPMWISPTKAPM